MSKILAFSGSARRDSWNQALVRIAARGAEAAGAEVTVADLADYAMPLYNGDLEAAEGLPAKALAFKQLMVEADGFLIASPEYNSSISPLLKNTIDWASRPGAEGEAPLSAYRGKAAVLMATSPGGLGGLRGLVHLRAILGNIGVIVLPGQRAVGGAGQAFADGELVDEEQRAAIEQLGADLAGFLQRGG